MISDEKQLGIFMIFDERLAPFKKLNERKDDPSLLWVSEALLMRVVICILMGRSVKGNNRRDSTRQVPWQGKEKRNIHLYEQSMR